MEKQATIPEIGKTVSVNGVRTNYHEQGEGPPLLLIHGSGPGVTAWANWRANLPELAKDFHVYAPDMIGFGYTDAPAGGIKDRQIWVDHLAGFLDAMGIEKASLVGNSFGGALAIAFMIAHPDRVDRAVLMGAAGVEFPITEALDYVWGYEPSMEMMRKTIAYLSTDPSRITEPHHRVADRVSLRGQQASRRGRTLFGHVRPETAPEPPQDAVQQRGGCRGDPARGADPSRQARPGDSARSF